MWWLIPVGFIVVAAAWILLVTTSGKQPRCRHAWVTDRMTTTDQYWIHNSHCQHCGEKKRRAQKKPLEYILIEQIRKMHGK